VLERESSRGRLSEPQPKIETVVETGHDPSARCARRRGNRDEPKSPRRKTETRPRRTNEEPALLIKNRTQKPELRRNLEELATQRCSLPETGQTHRTARLRARNQERAERWRAAGDAGAHASQDLNKIIAVEPRPSGGCKAYAWRHTSGGAQDGRPEAVKNQTNDSTATCCPRKR
jgi:hypothetical protein